MKLIEIYHKIASIFIESRIVLFHRDPGNHKTVRNQQRCCYPTFWETISTLLCYVTYGCSSVWEQFVGTNHQFKC